MQLCILPSTNGTWCPSSLDDHSHPPQILLKLDLHETRNFFSAFFSLSEHHWHGFLSARLTFTELIGFGLSLFAKSSSSARLGLIAKGLPGLVTMLARLTQIK